MKEIDIKLTPKNTNLPEREFKGVTDLEVVAENLYYDIYDLEIKSQWYEDVSQEINFTGEKVAEEIELPIRKGTVTIRLGSKATLEIYDQVVTNDTHSTKNYTFEIPYDDEPYPLEVTHPWRRGETVEITINPSQSEQEKTLTGGQIKPAKVVIKFTDRNGRAWTKELRTTYGNWTYNITEDGYVPENVKVLVEEDVVEVNQYLKTHEIKEEIETVKIPFDYKEEEDDQLLAEESYIKIPGEDGQKRVTYKVTYIDGEQTEKTIISQSTIKSPTHQVKVIGTKPKEFPHATKTATTIFNGNYPSVEFKVDSLPANATTENVIKLVINGKTISSISSVNASNNTIRLASSFKAQTGVTHDVPVGTAVTVYMSTPPRNN